MARRPFVRAKGLLHKYLASGSVLQCGEDLAAGQALAAG